MASTSGCLPVTSASAADLSTWIIIWAAGEVEQRLITSPSLAACVSIVEVALARPLRVRDELTEAVYVRRGAQGELPRHHRRDGEKQADVSGSLLVVAAVGPDTEALDALSEPSCLCATLMKVRSTT